MGGLFAHYAATPETVGAAGDDLASTGGAMDDAAQDAVRAGLPAVDSVWGWIMQPVRIVTDPLAIAGASLRSAAGFGGSAVNGWATSIRAYDLTIDAINAEWSAAESAAFGVPDVEPHGNAEAMQTAVEQYGLAVTAARSAKLAELTRRLHRADADLDDAADVMAAMLSRGPNAADWSVLGAAGVVPAAYMPSVPGGAPGEPGGPSFVLGPPTRPDFTWDEDFEYDSADPGFGDYVAREKWLAKLRGGQLLRSDLDDATQMYSLYWDNNGDPIEFDYKEAYNEDPGIRRAVANEIARVQQGAEMLIRAGNTDFSMTGDATGTTDAEYPETENWQKTVGGYQQWSSGDVTFSGDTVTMQVVVHAEDHYNFNRGQSDIATGAGDDENGRFTELGWAKPFDSHGAVTRTVTWQLGHAPDADTTDTGDPQRNPGREDREDERGSGDPDRPVVPGSNRDTGGPRAG